MISPLAQPKEQDFFERSIMDSLLVRLKRSRRRSLRTLALAFQYLVSGDIFTLVFHSWTGRDCKKPEWTSQPCFADRIRCLLDQGSCSRTLRLRPAGVVDLSDRPTQDACSYVQHSGLMSTHIACVLLPSAQIQVVEVRVS